jgi:CheY-like chemotaxis protein
VNGNEAAGGIAVHPVQQVNNPIADGGRLLLILTSRDVQSVVELAAASGQTATDTVRILKRLVDQGFLIVGDQHGTAVYQLRPKTEPASLSDFAKHVLLIEDDVVIGELIVTLLEDEGYAVVVCLTPVQATSLLQRVNFDLVITDGFSQVPGAVFANTAGIIGSAGVTPVALFSAHALDLALARAAGFADLIAKPFDLDTLMRQIKLLLGDMHWLGAQASSDGDVAWQLAASD